MSDDFEAHLSQLLPNETVLDAAARWALLGGGKRLRPRLLLQTVALLDGDQEAALTPAAALEMVHAYSLIHDDLPCMDDDDWRRGKASVHKQFGEATAILAGDYLLTYAFECLANAPDLSPDTCLSLIATLSRAAGRTGMIGGQLLDLLAEGKTLPLPELEQIHLKKTAALLTAALQMGATIAQADAVTHSALTTYGQHLGLAFQITDDILDVTHPTNKGGFTSSDLVNHKSTYVSHLGVPKAREAAQATIHQATAALSPFGPKAAPLISLAESLLTRTK